MDVILQTGSQLHAHRLQIYASSLRLQAFPHSSGICTAAEELGRETDHRGSCLVLLKNCKVSPEDLNHHIRSTFLRGYIVRVYWCGYSVSSRDELISHLKKLIDEHKEVNDEPDKEKYMRPYKQSEDAVDLSGNFSKVNKCESKLKVRLQTYPRDLADSLIDDLTDVDCQPHGFCHSLYAVYVDGIYRCGIESGTHMYLAPCDREDLARGSVSRASLKLEETLQVLGFRLHEEMTAMDLGASPGAWTQYLSRHIKKVVAVDPAPLDKQVLQSNVTHVRKMAQDAAEELGPWSIDKGFDLLVCDINRHPCEAAQVVSPLLAYLRTGGLLVLTLKFHGRGRDKKHKVDEIKGIFQECLTDMDCIWLLANSIYERTFVGLKV